MAHDRMARREVAAGLAAAALWPGRARATDVVVGPFATRLHPAEPPAYVPPVTIAAVRDIYRRMTAPVRVNGAGPFAFVVDTGSNQSVIGAGLATRLGLIVGAPSQVNGVAGAKSASTTTARLDVGSRRHAGAPLLILAEDDIGADGLLGLDDLDRQAVTLDFRRQELRIEPGRQLGGDPDAIILRARRRDGQLTLLEASLGGLRLTAFIDSGSQNTIGNLALKSRAAILHPGRPFVTAPILSATGQTMEAEVADLPSLRVGGVSIPNWPVAFADLYTFRLWGLIDRPAILLGVDVLSRFETVCLDFAHDEVRLRLPRAA